ncbi:hypothetical protein PpBr36_00470 [Pyricularia pennisetigena]|uniref:hypothetical protein n=1 Tax=Pyricularia pennisetigena TaxID=1578925 RepID=UPI00114E36B5|nr:hypothetical protein PpBr36_00470 [Pyricularia pennisetigena]TLS29686.1 hypothetical protein PpBr36_00470 [Pyricularia pennisetigena]
MHLTASSFPAPASALLPPTISDAATPQIPTGGGLPDKDHEGNLQNWSSLIGIITAIVGNVLIALALNVQRYAHIRLHRKRAEIKARARQALRDAKRKRQDLASAGSYGSLESSSTEHGKRDLDLVRRNIVEEEAEAGNGASDETEPLLQRFRSTGSQDEDGYVATTFPGGGKKQDDVSAISYLRSPYWWLGQILITVGEMGNFLAYGFAPASIVSPLGVVALISNCVIAPIIFKETFRQRDFWGVVVAVAGAVTVVFSANTQENKLAPDDVWHAITALEFEIYMGVSCFFIAFLMWASPRYGHRSILIDLGLVGLFGAYTALSTKGVSSMLSSTLLGAFRTPVTYVLLFVLLATAVMQVRYVNKALQRFDSTEVIPIQFVIFTLSVIIGSAVLYRDFEHTTAEQAVTFVGGCVLTFFGVFLITSGRSHHDEEEDNLSDIDEVEETIGLYNQQDQSGTGANTPAPTPGTDASGATAGRSRRTSRVSFMSQAGQPVTVVLDSGIPPLRKPPSRVLLDESEDPVMLGINAWADPSSHRGLHAANSNLRLTLPESVPGFSEPLARVHSEPVSAIHTPFNEVEPLMPATPSTGRTLAARPMTSGRSQQHHFLGPFFSPSPLSSTVSAVVADTMLFRSGEGPVLSKRLGMRRSRPSLRASLFVPHDESIADGGVAAADAITSWDDGSINNDASGSDLPSSSTRPSVGIRGRARSLSYTLGELFGTRSDRRRKTTLDGDNEDLETGGYDSSNTAA